MIPPELQISRAHLIPFDSITDLKDAIGRKERLPSSRSSRVSYVETSKSDDGTVGGKLKRVRGKLAELGTNVESAHGHDREDDLDDEPAGRKTRRMDGKRAKVIVEEEEEEVVERDGDDEWVPKPQRKSRRLRKISADE